MSTLSLLTRARAGDSQAMNDLFARFLPELQRFARGRLPRQARDLAETSDLVQDVLIRTFNGIGRFEYRGRGSLGGYLRTAVTNRIRNELRRSNRKPELEAIDEQHEDRAASPLEFAIGTEAMERYEAALQSLDTSDRELIVARVEVGLTYAELVSATGRASPDAARMAVGRALVRLAEKMNERRRQAD